MDPTQIFVEEMRSKRRFHIFKRPKFWFVLCILIFSVGLVVIAFNYLLARYM